MLLTCTFASILSISLQAYDESSKQNFLREYPAAAKEFADRLSVSAAKGVLKTNAKNRKKIETIEMRRDHGYEKVDAIVESYVGTAHVKSRLVFCLGPDTFFQLIKSNEKNDFALRSIGSTENDRLKYKLKYGSILWAPQGSYLGLLPELMKDKSFEITDVSTPDPKTGFVTLQFRYSDGEPKDTGKMTLDPSNHWAIISDEREVGRRSRAKISMNVEYGQKIDGFGMPKKVTFDGPGMPSSPFEFLEWKFESTPLDQFQLPYYQMPDVPLVKLNKGQHWTTFAAIGILIVLLVLLIGWIFRRLVRKKKSQAGGLGGN